MKKFFSCFTISCFLGCALYSQIPAQNAEELTRKIADNILQRSTFQFINKETGQTYTSLDGVKYSPTIEIESPYNVWLYWNGVVNMAMMQMSAAMSEKKYSDFVSKNYDFAFNNVSFFKENYQSQNRWAYPFAQFFTTEQLDECGAMGAGLADVYAVNKKKEYLEYLSKAATYISSGQVRLKDGTLVRPNPRKFTMWADDLYMSVPFLARMGKITGNTKYFDDAIRQVENFTKYLYNPATGLYYHCWYSDVNQNGVAQWGRSNGWVMMAQVELLNNLPSNHPKFKALTTILLKHIIGVSRYQDTSGLWRQLLDKPDSYLESSCTAMFIYSIAKAVNNGWIDKSYFSVAINGWNGLTAKIQPDGQVQDICIGTGIEDNIKFYYDRPKELNDIHGLGAILMAGIEMMNSEKINKP